MKITNLLLASIFSVCVSAVNAQDFKIGVKAGADIHKIDGKSFKDEFSYGYHLGGFATIGLTKKFAIQPEVLFSQVSSDTSNDFSEVYDFNSISKVQLKYLQIPLLLNYNPNPFVSLQVGPQFGILLDQNSSLVKNGKEAFSKGDFSMLGGIQLNISKVRLYGRYALGLNNINDIDNQEKWKNQNFQVGVGFAL
jgi:Outer membrane protein beta-barrel domain